jgi:hypothetical protein
MERLQYLISGLIEPFHNVVRLVQVVLAVPTVMLLAFRLKSWRLAGIALRAPVLVLATIVTSLIALPLVIFSFVVGTFVAVMGQVSGVAAFCVLSGFGTAWALRIQNDFDFLAVAFIAGMLFLASILALAAWAASGSDDGEEDFDQ